MRESSQTGFNKHPDTATAPTPTPVPSKQNAPRVDPPRQFGLDFQQEGDARVLHWAVRFPVSLFSVPHDDGLVQRVRRGGGGREP